MALKNRIGILIKSHFNHWMTRAEDPEKIVNQAVEEIEEGLDDAREKLAVLKFRVDQNERLLQRIDKQVSYWQQKAEGFIKEDMEENAKEAVRIKRTLQEEKRNLKIKHSEDEERLKDMEIGLKELESRAQIAKAKRNILIKNIRQEKGERVNENGEIEVEEPFYLFNKMEERIEEGPRITYLRRDKDDKLWEMEEKLVNEEIEMLKRNIKKGGSKK